MRCNARAPDAGSPGPLAVGTSKPAPAAEKTPRIVLRMDWPSASSRQASATCPKAHSSRLGCLGVARPAGWLPSLRLPHAAWPPPGPGAPAHGRRVWRPLWPAGGE
eukprot:9559499-Lingulodinium_polyedra.AAC.1